MNKFNIPLIVGTSLILQGCWAVFIPGSVMNSVSDSVTGAEGNNCVGPSAKVGDRIRMSDGRIGSVKSLSGTSTRCTSPELPIRALLTQLEEPGKPEQLSTKLSLSLPGGWDSRPFTEQMSKSETIIYAVNRTIDAGAILTTSKREGITDLLEFTNSRKANQMGRLTQAVQTDVESIDIGGRHAFRFLVTGATRNGTKITYMVTIIEGQTEIAMLNSWTSAANFENQRPALELLAQNIHGL